MRIGILGGSFDPPHLGHIFIAEQVKEQLDLDAIWFMPLGSHPFQKKISDVKHRLFMTNYLQTDDMRVSDFEIQHNPTSYTIDTLEMLPQEYPQTTFFWITGTDQLHSFQKYKRWQDIVAKHNLVIFPREYVLWHIEEKIKRSLDLQSIPENIIMLNNRELILTNISSTLIRERVKKGLPIHYLVPKDVEAYIKKNNLYK